jgi:hypothetical protein
MPWCVAVVNEALTVEAEGNQMSRMASTGILVLGIVSLLVASWENNLAAISVALFGTLIVYMLHGLEVKVAVLEVKVNALLDHYGIRVT